jgi:S1-C subfamily serine protease
MAAGTAGYLSADTVNDVLDRLGSNPSKVLDVAPPPGVEAIPAPATRSISQAHGASAAPDVRTIRAQVSPEAVELTVDQHYRGSTAGGTGMVLTSSGLVLTDEHVVTEADTITAQVGGTGRTYDVALIGVDLANDVALLQLEHASGLRTVTLGRSASVTVGDGIVVIGYPGSSAFAGRISGLSESVDVDVSPSERGASNEPKSRYSGMLHTDARNRAGTSGGPVVDTDGLVIGMVQVGGDTDDFDIPIDRALASAREIASGHSSADVLIGAPAELGVVARSWSPSAGAPGAKVVKVYPNTAAETVSLRAGDVISAIGDAAIASAPELRQVLARHHPGDRVGITWTDSRRHAHTVNVTLRTGPAP